MMWWLLLVGCAKSPYRLDFVEMRGLPQHSLWRAGGADEPVVVAHHTAVSLAHDAPAPQLGPTRVALDAVAACGRSYVWTHDAARGHELIDLWDGTTVASWQGFDRGSLAAVGVDDHIVVIDMSARQAIEVGCDGSQVRKDIIDRHIVCAGGCPRAFDPWPLQYPNEPAHAFIHQDTIEWLTMNATYMVRHMLEIDDLEVVHVASTKESAKGAALLGHDEREETWLWAAGRTENTQVFVEPSRSADVRGLDRSLWIIRAGGHVSRVDPETGCAEATWRVDAVWSGDVEDLIYADGRGDDVRMAIGLSAVPSKQVEVVVVDTRRPTEARFLDGRVGRDEWVEMGAAVTAVATAEHCLLPY